MIWAKFWKTLHNWEITEVSDSSHESQTTGRFRPPIWSKFGYNRNLCNTLVQSTLIFIIRIICMRREYYHPWPAELRSSFQGSFAVTFVAYEFFQMFILISYEHESANYHQMLWSLTKQARAKSQFNAASLKICRARELFAR